jgi:ribonuclease P protein component
LSLSFHKEEHLCSRKAFETLISDGSSYFCFPFRVQWIKTDYPVPYPAQIAFAVPKKRFKRANKRNLIRRRIREIYRLNKQPFYQFLETKGVRIQLLIVYIAPKILTYHEIEPKIQNIMDHIMATIQKDT